MDLVKIQQTRGKGNGVFAKRWLSPKDRIYGVTDFALSAISTHQLSDFCYHCYAGSRYEGDKWYSIGQYRNADLKICTGCKIARFCGKACQTQAWKKYHKHECKIFSKLYPNVLPESVRAVVRFALQRTNGTLPAGAWESILSLQSHHKQLQTQGGNDWVDLNLMAKASAEYSRAADATEFLLLLCILKINAITLQTTYNDPIGLVLDPFLATINHSCDPNIVLHRPTYTNAAGWLQRRQTGQVACHVLPLRQIAQDEELTVSYIDFQEHVSQRQANLKKNYLFTCTCSKCNLDLKAEVHLMQRDPEEAKLQVTWRLQADEQFEILTTPPFSPKTLSDAITNLTALVETMESSPTFSPTTDPYNRVIQELKLLQTNDRIRVDLSLICALKQHLLIGPELYSSPIHPTRIVNAIYTLQLLAHIDDTFQQAPVSAPHDPKMVEARQKLEKKGLSHRSVGCWRMRIATDMRDTLRDNIIEDLGQVFEMERVSIGANHRDVFAHLLVRDSIRIQAETEMRTVLGMTETRWTDSRRHQEATREKWLNGSSGANV